MNHRRRAADPVLRVAVAAGSGRCTGSLAVKPLGVHGGGHVPRSVEPLLQVPRDLVDAGLTDVWSVANAGKDGFTGSQEEDLLNTPSALSERIDLIFVRGADDISVVKAAIVGADLEDRTPSGLWPSDHAGVVASVRLARQ